MKYCVSSWLFTRIIPICAVNRTYISWYAAHSQHKIINLCQVAVNFGERNTFRPSRPSRNANFYVWPRSQCRCCTSTYPWNDILLAESCAMRYTFSLLQVLPPDRKKEKYVIGTSVTGWQNLRNEPALNIYGINTCLVLTKPNWSTQAIWAYRIYVLKKDRRSANVLLLFVVPTAGILNVWTGIIYEYS